ncbi:MAG: hypothetical protein HN368_13695 [Spirochaetales bacterium]|mgnify:CR=1 FL=1|jgi:hypothetical protein|nr:hypothetical protein [Spirochaetales bacterium]
MYSGDFILSHAEMVPLYKLLKKNETELELELLQVLLRIEKKLYDQMSIEEIEKLGLNRDRKDGGSV